MKGWSGTAAAIRVATALAVTATGPLAGQGRYPRAEQLLEWNLQPKLFGVPDGPQWLPDGNRFWYAVDTPQGTQFILIDPIQNTRRPVFDPVRLAAAMSIADDSTTYDPARLPFRQFRFADDNTNEGMVVFSAGDKQFACNIITYWCEPEEAQPDSRGFVRSPDGRLEAFVHEYDLYVRTVPGGDSTALTNDGERFWAYGITEPRPTQQRGQIPSRPVLQWSPDSRKLAVQRMDERGVKMMHVISSTPTRPEHYAYPYPLPEDSIIPRFDIHIIDIDRRTNIRVEAEPQPYLTFTATGVTDSTWITVRWSRTGDRLYFTQGSRGGKRIQLLVADAATGASRKLIEEAGRTHVELNQFIISKPNWTVVNAGADIIWFSQRSGWSHLYRYGGDGTLRHQITSGPWNVGDIIHVDEARERIYFTARGRELDRIPMVARFYAVNLDGSNLVRLDGEDGDHLVAVSPNGRFFVDRYSQVDVAPTTVLRDRNGRVLRTLERGDVTSLLAAGWRPPEPFTVKARDGVTDLYGLMYRPSDFDSTVRYPVVEYIYPGPYTGSVGLWRFTLGGIHRRADQHALAELGFIVIQIDPLGSPFRSKTFSDAWYGRMGDNGVPDHVSGLKQLAQRHRFLDLDRVGIYGHSGGGFASLRAMLAHPELYKVAVSSSGNHDNRTYHAAYGEKFHGLYQRDSVTGRSNFDSQANQLLVDKLQGKLLLITGDVDDNVNPAMTLQVAGALIRANKSFDFLIMPDRGHTDIRSDPYFIRRRWDYFVEHLRGESPPVDYAIRPPSR